MNKKFACGVLLLLFIVTACSQQNDIGLGNGETKPFRLQRSPVEEERMRNHAHPKLLLVANGQSVGEVKAHHIDHVWYVPLVQTLELLNFNVEQKENHYLVGFSDPYITLERESNRVVIEEQNRNLPFRLLTKDNKEWISVPSLKELLGEYAEAKTRKGKLYLRTEQDANLYGFEQPESLDQLPVRGAKALNKGKSNDANEEMVVDRIVQEAKRHVGAAYQLGAPTDQNEAFDSSSFVQYVFQQSGFDLPRTVRNQAKLGQVVPVSSLQPGDLLFFAWPGNEKSNKIVGHVGIYTGDGYMIHCSPTPKNGVQLENIGDADSPFRSVFLGAKRILVENET